MKNITFKYPNKLKELRKTHKLTQKDVSTYLEFTGEERISRWEKGYALPSIPNLIKLSKLFKVHADEIYLE